ncbi:MAG TPA: hypothetical protein ENF78_02930 [Candidatus Bathyarchaeota archaeon]|nr:hypothetical protein [Candidatus Bathyarchaeota archaeon]
MAIMVLLSLMLLLAPLAPSGPATYHLMVEKGSWAQYQVICAEGAEIYGVTIREGSSLKFCLSGSEILPSKGPSGQVAFYAEWPKCDVYLDDELVAKNASTYFIWPFWPSEGDFWDALGSLNGLSVKRNGDVILVEAISHELDLRARWEVRSADGLTLYYEAEGLGGGMVLRLDLEKTNLSPVSPDNHDDVAPLDYTACALAALVIIVIAGLTSLATRGGVEWS